MHSASNTRRFTHQAASLVPAGAGDLFSPYALGPLVLPNRIVMAPLTRSRADRNGVPSLLAPGYYAQRASAGLIISEAATVSRQGTGYDNGPGLYTDEQIAGWQAITDAVHEAGGRIFVQLFHVGRMSHPAFQEGGLPVGASAVAAGPATERYDGTHSFTRPRALQITELAGIAGQFRAAAERALATRFDGVEVHAANGYLLDQFLQDGANRRTDRYGGPPANRVRLPREVVEAVTDLWGADRVGVRISPLNPTNGMYDSDPAATSTQAAQDLDRLGVVYLHVVEPGVNGTMSEPARLKSPYLGSKFFRPLFSRTIIAAGGHTARTGGARIERGRRGLDRIRQAVHLQPGPAGPVCLRCTAHRARPRHLLRRRGRGLHRLPDPGPSGRPCGGPACGLSASAASERSR